MIHTKKAIEIVQAYFDENPPSCEYEKWILNDDITEYEEGWLFRYYCDFNIIEFYEEYKEYEKYKRENRSDETKTLLEQNKTRALLVSRDSGEIKLLNKEDFNTLHFKRQSVFRMLLTNPIATILYLILIGSPGVFFYKISQTPNSINFVFSGVVAAVYYCYIAYTVMSLIYKNKALDIKVSIFHYIAVRSWSIVALGLCCFCVIFPIVLKPDSIRMLSFNNHWSGLIIYEALCLLFGAFSSILIYPMFFYHLALEINGGEKEPYDRVLILVGENKGKVTNVCSAGQGTSVYVEVNTGKIKLGRIVTLI